MNYPDYRDPEIPMLAPTIELVGEGVTSGIEVDQRLTILKEVTLAMPRSDVFDLIRAAEWVLYGPDTETLTEKGADSGESN